MRELLTHPLRALALFVVLTLLGEAAAQALPLAIGCLSDYGNVLDRYGRDQVSGLIADAEKRLGVAVHILASWEDPYKNAERYAREVQAAWGLGQGKTLLVVFTKTEGDWSVAVLAGGALTSARPRLAGSVVRGLSDLVAHDRVKEAMLRLFDLLEEGMATATPSRPRAPGATGRTIGFVLLGVIGLLSLLFLASRFLCPQCARPLRRREGLSSVLYSCRHCGYRRTKRRGLGGRGGTYSL